MIKMYRNYISFFQHLVMNEYSFAIKINNTFYQNQKEEFEASLNQPRYTRYYRISPGADNEHLHRRRLLGGLQPLVDIQKDFVNTFRLYKSWRHIGTDALQPIRGIGNILRGVLTFIGACLYTPLVKSGIIREYEPMRTNYGASWFLDSFSSVVRGVTQVLFTPFVPIKILFRGFVTSIMGWQKVEKDIGINRLVAEAARLTENSEGSALAPSNGIEAIADELERKVDKAKRNNRPRSLVVDENNRAAVVVRAIFLYKGLERENRSLEEKIVKGFTGDFVNPTLAGTRPTKSAAQIESETSGAVDLIHGKRQIIDSLSTAVRQPGFYRTRKG
ncbi:MAG: hypothetical protein ACHQAX_05335 [Gammaproteobacteria bacterium]